MYGSLGTAGLFILPFALVVGLAVLVVPACLVCRKAGYIPWLGVLAIVPLVNLLFLYFVALAQWPVERELESLRSRIASGA